MIKLLVPLRCDVSGYKLSVEIGYLRMREYVALTTVLERILLIDADDSLSISIIFKFEVTNYV